MAHQQQFSEGLLRQINDLNLRNLNLQRELAQKDDQLSHSNRLLRNALGASQHSSVQTLQQRIDELQNQLRQAIEANASSRQNFDRLYGEKEREVAQLQNQLQIAIDNGGGGSKHTLRNTKAELKRLKNAYANLQKQFEAEKNDACRQQQFPATAAEKSGFQSQYHDDRDDEEPAMPKIKKEEQQQERMPSVFITPAPQAQMSALTERSQSFRTPSVCSFTAPQTRASVSSQPPASALERLQREQKLVIQQPSSPQLSSYQTPQPPIYKELSVFKKPSYLASSNNNNHKKRSIAESQQTDGDQSHDVLFVRSDAVDVPPPAPKKRKRSVVEEQAEAAQELDDLEIIQSPLPTSRQRSSTSYSASSANNRTTPAPPRPSTRKRGEQDEAAIELDDLEIQSPPTRRKRSSTSIASSRRSSGTTAKQDAVENLKNSFQFNAITDYTSDGEVYSFSSSDLQDNSQELWERILPCYESWSEAKGDDWKYEFEEKLIDRKARACVSTKFRVEGREHGKPRWREGCEGKYACRSCVEEKKPCFFWNGEVFQLLPRHGEDRTVRLEDGFEIRYWLDIE